MNIYARKDGRFEIRYHYGYKENGTPNYKSIYGNSKEEVKKIYRETWRQYIQKNDLQIYDKSYIGYDINAWLKNVKIKNKKSTYSNYQYLVRSRIIPTFANIKKKSISSEFINQFTNDLLNEGLRQKSVKDILIVLQQILNYGNIHIKISMPKVPKNEIQIFQKEQLVKLEEELQKNSNEEAFGIYICLYTGLRIGEICALQWKNIDLKNKKIAIKKTLIRIKNADENSKRKTIVIIDEPKSQSSIREIPIPNFLIPIMEEFSQNITPETFLLSGTEKYIVF